MLYIYMQYQSTLPHPQCLEMVTVQLFTDLAAMDVKQTSAIAVKNTYTYTLVLIAAESLSLE